MVANKLRNLICIYAIIFWIMQIALCVLVSVAGLSPLLTFTRLFQLKEWRRDRLREHLRREGRLNQLFGVVRPIVVASGLLLFWMSSIFIDEEIFPSNYVLWGTMGLLAWFTLFRFVVGKQICPMWTKKSITITLLAILLFERTACIIASIPGADIALLLLSLFSFIFVFIIWLLLLPLDRFLKRRILLSARRLRDEYKNLTVIGITGSVGKTTTKDLLAHILSDRKILVTPAHVNTEMGVANLMIKKLSEEHQIFIVEMGAYRRGEIALLCSLSRPQFGVITFIGKQHLGLFGSQEELCLAKGELFTALPASGRAFLNADTVFCENLMKSASCPVNTVGTGGHATYEAFEIQEGTNGVSFTVRGEKFFVPLQGTHQVTNVLLAVAVAEALNIPLAESSKRLKTFHGMPQTFEKKEGKSGQVVLDDTHNASPASFRAAIEWSRTYNAKTKILVTSGLLELGKEENAIHKELGMLCKGIFDEVVFLSKKCVRSFEHGYGKTVSRAPKKKFRMKFGEDMLIVCEGRMPESVVERLLS